MPGSALAVAVVGCAAVAVVGFVTVGAAASFGQRLAGIADAVALAAADAASGAVLGVPCERAEEVAGVSQAVVTSCSLDELVATVTVSARFGVVPVTASARAGPAP